MDKTEKNVLDFMMLKTYDDVMFDVISSWILLDVAEIKNTLKIDKAFLEKTLSRYPVERHAEVLVAIKDKVFVKLMQSHDTKKHMLRLFSEFYRKKEETAHELMRQYGLLKDAEKDYIFNSMCELFEKNFKKVKRILEKGDYYSLYRAELSQ
jgi:mevalonate kinase